MRILELKMSSNHKMMRMRLREKRKLIDNKINGGKENLELKRCREDRRKMKKYKIMIVGNEKLGQNITFFVIGNWRPEAPSLVRRHLYRYDRGLTFFKMATRRTVAGSSPSPQ